MKVSQLYIYPIKSLRGTLVTNAKINKTGFVHDRQYMLLKVEEDAENGTLSYKNMHVPHYPEMGLFTVEFQASGSELLVTYTPAPDSVYQKKRTLEVPLFPDEKELETFEVNMHSAPTTAYRMPSKYADWFSGCFGYEVVLAYLGQNSRSVLGTLSPNAQRANDNNGYLSSLKNMVGLGAGGNKAEISFADCANFLVVTEESLDNTSDRLPEGETMDVTKYRPNIVLSGADKAWDEDFWGRLLVGEGDQKVDIEFTSNCVRCKSINVDYSTGKPGTGASGQMLKKLQSDRRVDLGSKYSPVFGRYGYIGKEAWEKTISVGQEAEVTKRNETHTAFDWPGIGGIPKEGLVRSS